MATIEIEKKVKLELKNERTQEQLNAFEASEVEEMKAPSSLSMKLNVISGKTFGMVPQGSKMQSKISLAGHQVIRNLREPSEFTMMQLDIYADYLRQAEPRTESRTVRESHKETSRALRGSLRTLSTAVKRDVISFYTKTYVTTDSDQIGQIFLGQEELKVCIIGHDAMMAHDAVQIGYAADMTAHLLDTDGKRIQVTELLTGAVFRVMPIKTWQRMAITTEDLSPTNVRLEAANRGAVYVARRTPITVLHVGGQNLWMSFLLVENMDDSMQISSIWVATLPGTST